MGFSGSLFKYFVPSTVTQDTNAITYVITTQVMS